VNTNLPLAVRVDIQMSGNNNNAQPIEILVPIDSVSRTNMVLTGSTGSLNENSTSNIQHSTPNTEWCLGCGGIEGSTFVVECWMFPIRLRAHHRALGGHWPGEYRVVFRKFDDL
jgi:hypothetical protein